MEDPLERIIRLALEDAELEFQHPHQGTNLDFYVPALDIYIEVKAFHSERIADQMARVPNVIAVQGRTAVNALADFIRGVRDNRGSDQGQ